MPKKTPAMTGLAMPGHPSGKDFNYDKVLPEGYKDEGMPTFPGEVNGSTIKKNKGSGLKTVLLRAKPGCGKTRFYLTHLLLAVEQVYKQMTDKDLDYKDSENWTPQVSKDVQEAAKHCLMLVIDMDYQGVDDLIERDDIIPPEVAGSIYIMGVSGLMHKDGIRFYEALDVRDKFLKKLQWHSEKYPDDRTHRFLVLDNTGELYRETLDKYFYDTSGGEIKSMKEKMQKDEAEYHRRLRDTGKDRPKWKVQGDDGQRIKKVALFESGRRDSFRVIDADYRGFYRNILKYKPGFGFNFYATTHVIEYTGEEGEGQNKKKVEKSFADGRADDLLIGYFNLVLTFNKVQKYKKNDEGQIIGIDVKGYYVDTAIGAKNRLGPDLFMNITGKGAKEFYDELNKRVITEETR